MIKNILLAFICCIFITALLSGIYRPGSSLFLPYLFLQTIAFMVMLLSVFLFAKYATKLASQFIYLLSLLIAYIMLMFVIWRINGADLLQFVVKYHQGKDFFSMVLPFVITNIFVLIWLIVKNHRVKR